MGALAYKIKKILEDLFFGRLLFVTYMNDQYNTDNLF